GILYLYSGWQCIEEREDDGGTWEARRQYVYSGTYIDELLIFDKDTDDDGVCDDERYYYCQQANYNVVAMAKDNGNGTATVTVEGGQSASGNVLLFQGRRWASEAGLYYFRNRDHDPELGRFLQRDALGYVDGMSLYQYESGNPVIATDPMGGCVQRRTTVPVAPTGNCEVGYFTKSMQPLTDCGGALWHVTWDIAPTQPSFRGHIVQKVTRKYDYCWCCDDTSALDAGDVWRNEIKHFSEVFDVEWVDRHGVSGDEWRTVDRGREKGGEKTYGWITWEGEAKGLVGWKEEGSGFARGTVPAAGDSHLRFRPVTCGPLPFGCGLSALRMHKWRKGF
ncbi:MAG: RHS repeat-associated core domain-containing protein, partial [Planctomycetes bacterium]|nr:RHS repeat-associated core domain-containing protein [Planctomycetota bacterium]